MNPHHHRKTAPGLTRTNRPHDIQIQAILGNPLFRNIQQRQRRIPLSQLLRTGRTGLRSIDDSICRKCERLRRLEPIRPSGILSVRYTEEDLHAVAQETQVRDVVVGLVSFGCGCDGSRNHADDGSEQLHAGRPKELFQAVFTVGSSGSNGGDLYKVEVWVEE